MKNMMGWQSPAGWMSLVAGDRGIRRVEFYAHKGPLVEKAPQDPAGRTSRDATQLLQAARRQIDAYLAGTATGFDLPLDLADLSPFGRKVLQALTKIPYGTTVTYGELGRMVRAVGAGRAVGRVMAANPLPIVIPCHRVIAASGGLGGYSGGEGLASKRWLLELEGVLTASGFSGKAAKAQR